MHWCADYRWSQSALSTSNHTEIALKRTKNVPSKGLFYSQLGNILFPVREQFIPNLGKFSCQCLFAHPGGDALLHALLEGGAEGAVAVVAALLGQLLGNDGLMCSGKFAVAGYEVTDAKVVDVCIVACTLIGEILAEIVTVHADGFRELRQVQVWLQVELCVLTVTRQ